MVARASSTPDCHGHSHTGSIWALPIMWTRISGTLPQDADSALDGAAHEGADDETLEGEEDDDGRNDRQHARGSKKLGRLRAVGALEIEDADRDGEERRPAKQDERNDELRPTEDGVEHERRGE